MNVKKAELKDVLILGQMLAKLKKFTFDFRPRFDELSDNLTEACTKIMEEMVTNETDLVLVAEENKKIVGLLAVSPIKKEAYYKNRDRAEIFYFFIEKGFRKKGIGKRLIEKAEKELKKRKIKIVEVTTVLRKEENKKIYKKFGFKEELLTLKKELP